MPFVSQPYHKNISSSSNELELLAIRHAVISFLPLFPNTKNRRIMTDNSTSVSFINKQRGTHSPMYNKLTIEIWEICI